MKIITTQYTFSNMSLDIYTSGCKSPHCRGCFNPETWNFDQGNEWGEEEFIKIKNKVNDFSNIIDKISIFGGEPLDNPIDEVIIFLGDLSFLGLPIWLFTSFLFDDIHDNIKHLCAYIKCGKYDDTKLVDNNIQYGVKLASSNQKIYKLR